jgi:DNA-binding NarL/FixJ family response regulator
MEAKVRLGICHRSRLWRESLSIALVSDDIEITVIDEPLEDASAPLWQDCLVLLIDASLPDMLAFKLILGLRTTSRTVKAILLVPSSAPDLVESCLKAGAAACVLDDDSLDDLRQAIKNVRAGRSYCSPSIAQCLFSPQIGRYAHSIIGNMPGRDCELTGRELEVLSLIACHNLNNKQIARKLGVSPYTVKNHMHNIFAKLGVENRQAAVRYARRYGLLPVSFA